VVTTPEISAVRVPIEGDWVVETNNIKVGGLIDNRIDRPKMVAVLNDIDVCG
jgi:hypothetical protein